MKSVFVLFFIAPFFTIAQSNYFVNNGNLNFLTVAHDGGYVGEGEDGLMVKVNHNFELEWAKGEFKGELIDLLIDEDLGVITAMHQYENECRISILDSDGEIINRKGFVFEGDLNGAEMEEMTGGYALAFNAFVSADASQPSVVFGRINADLEFDWLKSFETPENFMLEEMDLLSYSDSIAILATSAWADTNYSTFSRFSQDGAFISANRLGTECTYYVDFERLPEGGFVAVGELKRDEMEELKISVLSADGEIIATKQKGHSGSDQGWNRARVAILSDGRYVVANNYYPGAGSYNQCKLYFFDNHKAVGRWSYSPEFFGEDRNHCYLWGVDGNDQLLLTGETISEEYWGMANFTMGRMTWLSEDCEIGTEGTANFRYAVEPTTEITLGEEGFDALIEIDIFDGLEDEEYSNEFYCMSEGSDPGLVVEDDHLYGDEVIDCNTLVHEEEPVDDTGLKENKLDLSVYPNPSAGDVVIRTTGEGNISVMDVQGNLVQTIPVSNQMVQLSLGEAKGLYIIRFLNNQGEVSFAKVIKQ